jgi:hypothetical protein
MGCKILNDTAGGESEVGGWREEGQGKFFFLFSIFFLFSHYSRGLSLAPKKMGTQPERTQGERPARARIFKRL